MANKRYIERLRRVIRQLHGCDSSHRETVPVQQLFRGQTVWKGQVEVFDLTGHAHAQRCYAWSLNEIQDEHGERFIAVLEIAPVISPETAVQASIVADPTHGYR